MQLLCLGDVALDHSSANMDPWPRPLQDTVQRDRCCILFNWEAPCGETFSKPRSNGGVRLTASPASVKALRSWAPAVAALANNHLMDAGIDGVARTIDALQEVGISSFGGGTSPELASRPWIWETPEGRLGVLNWVTPETHPEPMGDGGPGPNLWPGHEIAGTQVDELRREVDWVVVYIHWSDELFAYPRPADRELARRLIELGADAVVGHHSHVVRGIEEIHGKPVFYSLGNYFFSNVPSPGGGWTVKQVARNREALVVELSFNRGKPIGWHLHSYWQEATGTRPDPRDRAVRQVAQASRPFSRPDYCDWHERARGRFDRWVYRYHFRLPAIGVLGAARWMLRLGRDRRGAHA